MKALVTLPAGVERAVERVESRHPRGLPRVWEPGSQDPEQSDTFILEPLLGLCRERAELLMWGGRARWKIENETFNTLKNQGYHFEHNYGHGYQHLSVVLAMLMLLAFW